MGEADNQGKDRVRAGEKTNKKKSVCGQGELGGPGRAVGE